MYKQVNHICEFLTEHKIGHHVDVCRDGTELVYIDHGPFGYPKGVKLGEFRPDFRLSTTECSDENTVYTRLCGSIRHMSLNDVLKVIEEWSS